MKLKLQIMFALLMAASLSSCSIRQTVKPLEGPRPSSICIAENKLVSQKEFLPALIKGIEARGIKGVLIPAVYTKSRDNSLSTNWDPVTVRDCGLVATYNAQWRWDIALYMVLANVRLYRLQQSGSATDALLVGNALYDASHGGYRLDKKWINAEKKLDELLDQLLGSTTTAAAPVQIPTPKPDATPVPAPSKTTGEKDASVRLQKLEELRKQGLITEQEYKSKRAEIVNGI